MNICMYMYMNHVDVNLQMYEKIDIIFLIFQEKTRIMRKYEVIFYVRTQYVIFFKKVYQCFREFLIKTIHWFTSIWKKMILLNQIMLK